jgi:hypothetical protein
MNTGHEWLQPKGGYPVSDESVGASSACNQRPTDACGASRAGHGCQARSSFTSRQTSRAVSGHGIRWAVCAALFSELGQWQLSENAGATASPQRGTLIEHLEACFLAAIMFPWEAPFERLCLLGHGGEGSAH